MTTQIRFINSTPSAKGADSASITRSGSRREEGGLGIKELVMIKAVRMAA
ncbi:MAG: hypothetical protein AAGF78_03010 [Pseudomonadota bacterium]